MRGEADRTPRLIGEPIDYSDGAEGELWRIIANASDRSSRSDELASHIRDWPTKYHLSRLRSNLIRPIKIREGQRIVDVGAGTGTIARYLGEQRASVLAVEGSVARARITRERCRDLENVEVVAGDITGLEVDGSFDLAVAIGVLEYAAAPLHGPGAGVRFLAHLAGLIAGDGAVVLAIENQLGLKYLLGLPEDHLGEPGIGVEGYPLDAVAQTFSRRRLAAMLGEVGLTSQRWLFPFPDYKHPTVVIGDTLYEVDEAPVLIDQLLRAPVVAHDTEAPPWADPRRTHNSLLEAGLGPDVANSFLVVAGRDEASIGRFFNLDDLAWLYGDERRSVWLRDRVLVQSNSTLSLRLQSGQDRAEQWLRHTLHDEIDFEVGRSMEQLALDACRAGERDSLSALLGHWLGAIEEHEVDSIGGDEHPFSPNGDERALPGSYLDINLDNFIERGDGSGIAFIDDEWSASGPVSFPLVVYRALWWFARGLVGSSSSRMWQPSTTVKELAMELGGLVNLEISSNLHDRFVSAESQLQQLVSGGTQDEHSEHIEGVSAASTQQQEESLSRLRGESEHRLQVIKDLQVENNHRLEVIQGLQVENDDRLEVIQGLQVENDHRLRTIEDLLEIRQVLNTEIEQLRSIVARIEEELQAERAARLQLEDSLRSSRIASFVLRRELP